ncbi:MAG: hypothetical protein IJU66_06285 [Oscillospiraceae bacterium]|nr:hypothetical protein [Oscillospiraceae bacterium]
MKKSIKLLPFLCLLLLLPLLSPCARAAELDEILRFEITVDVNPDATLSMIYHIDWKVLDSTTDGPLNWVKIGIPNSRYVSMTPRSACVREIGYTTGGGSYVRVDLDRDYYAGEVAQIEFELVQDYMYQVDASREGETVYSFTPSWFDDIRVDELTVRWSDDKVLSVLPGTESHGGYYTWTKPLDKGEKLTVSVAYDNNAFGFDTSKTIEEGDEEDDWFYIIVGAVVFISMAVSAIGAIIGAISVFSRAANFSSGKKTKITRTKVVYWPTCQGCGAPRPDGANNCTYCGRSFIKSEEVIKEEDIPAEERDLRGKTTDGLYRYSSQPNTYMRVHVTHVPVPSSSHSSSRGGRSSCAHSSCACACACACAGGGRAGCSTKDFYNTRLKLRQLERKRGKHV